MAACAGALCAMPLSATMADEDRAVQARVAYAVLAVAGSVAGFMVEWRSKQGNTSSELETETSACHDDCEEVQLHRLLSCKLCLQSGKHDALTV
jgi:hypothetical protein